MDPRITLAEVEHVARLARLELRPEDKERMRRELDGILAYIDKLRALDVDGVEPTSHAVPLTNISGHEPRRPFRATDAEHPILTDFRVPKITRIER
jgi:aspartyl-tRNA(Asn)/glutamyl-tRNA(Gln) amidotransferase subunit C